MSEIVVETISEEVVIDIEGGPTLTTTVNQEVSTLVETPASPVVIDLNSGARGEPGSALIAGDEYPGPEIGTVGDVYIILGEEEPEFLGTVLQKSTLGWVVQGNIRGPVGGINSVNGYTLPDVVLTKADLGLGNADNTSDANKPISTATQTALDLKAVDSNTVHKTGAETIAGIKTFSDKPVVPDATFTIAKTTSLQTTLDGKVALVGNQTISDTKTFSKTPLVTPETGAMLPTQMTAHNMHMFHDRFRFTAPTFQTSADGTNWNAPATTGHNVLDGRSDTSLAVNHDFRYLRWYWDNTHDMAYANITRLIARWGYTAVTPDAIVTVESSANGTAWTSRGTTTMTGASTAMHTMVLADNGGDTYYRVTIQVTGGAGSGTVAVLHMLEVQNYRHGSQGKGFEVEQPFWWNVTREIGLYNHLRPLTANVFDLGLTGTRFRDGFFNGTVYAGIISATTLNGNGAAITALNGTNISTGTVADARLSTNVSLLNGAQTYTGAKTFTGAVIVPTPTLSTHAATKGYIDSIVDAAPGTLDTLNELAAALGDDPNFATTMTNSLASKVSLTGAQTISGVKTFTDVVSIENGELRIGTSTTARNVLMADASGYATWGNPMLIAATKNETDNANTYTYQGVYIQDSAGGTGWPEGFGVILTAWHSAERAFQIAYGKGSQQFKVRASNGAGTNGWNSWIMLANDATVAHLAGAETISGVKTFSATMNTAAVNMGGTLTINPSSNAAIEIGRVDGTASTPFIDFHAGATATDYDVRLIATIGTGAAGAGTLEIKAGTAAFSGAITAVGAITAASFAGSGASLTTLNGTNISTGTVAIPRLPAGVVYRVVHDGVNWPARPTGATYVEWVGPVVPSAATANDTWVNTSV